MPALAALCQTQHCRKLSWRVAPCRALLAHAVRAAFSYWLVRLYGGARMNPRFSAQPCHRPFSDRFCRSRRPFV